VEAFPQTTVVLTTAQKNGDFSADGTTVVNPSNRPALPQQHDSPVAVERGFSEHRQQLHAPAQQQRRYKLWPELPSVI